VGMGACAKGGQSRGMTKGLAGYVLHDWHGAFADERDGHRVGAHAVARDAAGGVGSVGPRKPPIVRIAKLPASHPHAEEPMSGRPH
jgi:hypothetical protein